MSPKYWANIGQTIDKQLKQITTDDSESVRRPSVYSFVSHIYYLLVRGEQEAPVLNDDDDEAPVKSQDFDAGATMWLALIGPLIDLNKTNAPAWHCCGDLFNIAQNEGIRLLMAEEGGAIKHAIN